MKRLVVVIAVLTLAACTQNAALEQLARVLMDAADECLLDIRDRNTSYDISRNCASLNKLSLAYIKAGGAKPDASPTMDLVNFHKARAIAWSAVALSNGKYRDRPPIRSIW